MHVQTEEGVGVLLNSRMLYCFILCCRIEGAKRAGKRDRNKRKKKKHVHYTVEEEESVCVCVWGGGGGGVGVLERKIV